LRALRVPRFGRTVKHWADVAESSPVIMFVRLSAILIVIGRLVGERKSSKVSYVTFFNHLLDTTSADVLPLVEIIPFGIVNSATFRELTVLSLLAGCVVVFFFPRRRIGYVVAFVGMFAMAFLNHLFAAAHITAIYLVLFLLLLIQPPTIQNELKVRRNLVTALASMYLFSALSKMSAFYLNGDVIVNTFAELIRWPLFSGLHYRPVVAMFAFWGIALELLGVLILVPRFRRLGLLAAILFHLLVGASIIKVVNITAYVLTLPILFSSDRDSVSGDTSRFFVWEGVIVTFLMVWSVIDQFLPSDVMRWIYDFVSWFWIFTIGYVLVRSIRKRSLWQGAGFSWLAFLVSTTFFLAAWIFSWPEPLGYTQYSGRERVFYGAIYSDHENRADQEIMKGMKSRWGVRYFSLGNGTVLGLFPTRVISKHATEVFCLKFPTASITEVETQSRGSNFVMGRGVSVLPVPYRVTSGRIECSKFGTVD
jgi:hypothetical protein